MQGGQAAWAEKPAEAPGGAGKQVQDERYAKGAPPGELLAEATGLAKHSIAVPETLYGSAMMAPILMESKCFVDWLQRSGESYLRLALNVFLQNAFLVGVWQIRQWQADTVDLQTDCWRIAPWFFVICLWIFFASILTEIEETFYMIKLLFRQIPTVKETALLRYAKDEEGNLILASGGMSCGRKCLVMLLVLLPKLEIGVGMIVIGGSFLATSTSNTDMLLNSLAAVFIVELDELIYAFLVPRRMQRLIAEIPPFEDDDSSVFWEVFNRSAMAIKLLVSGMLVVIMHLETTYCPNSPCTGAIRTCPVI